MRNLVSLFVQDFRLIMKFFIVLVFSIVLFFSFFLFQFIFEHRIKKERKVKILRLLITDKCLRNCKDCCNKQWNLRKLPVENDYSKYSEILLTGGEPLLFPYSVIKVIGEIRNFTQGTKIYLYTAMVENANKVLMVLDFLDGLTVTLHEQKDVEYFSKLNDLLQCNNYSKKSLRLNIFSGVDIGKINLSCWKVKKDIVWIENCPLPKNEVFKRYKMLF